MKQQSESSLFIMIINCKLLAVIVLYRLISAWLTENYEYPDEHWQGPEVAHHIQYGYGYLTWEWTMQQPLRNPLYPYILSLSYKIVDVLHLPVSLLPYACRFIIQAPIAILTDWYMLKILKYIYGSSLLLITVLSVFCNWYYASILTRTYFNSFETCLTMIGFYFWVTKQQGQNNYKDFINRAIVVVSYISRPTSIIVWALLWPYELLLIFKNNGIASTKPYRYIFSRLLTIIIMLMLSYALATLFYGRPTLTELNFIKYNFIQKWSQFYGKENFLFYFGISLPFILNFTLILFVVSVLLLLRKNNKKDSDEIYIKHDKIKVMLVLSLTYLLISSFSTHKQHRFIASIIPFILLVSTYCLQTSKTLKLFSVLTLSKKVIKLVLLLIVITNLALFTAFSTYGKSNGIAAWKYIGQKIQNISTNQTSLSVIVMGQSHFMPGYSVLHKRIMYKIPDSSAIMMSSNSSENMLLSSDPGKLYDILTEQLAFKPTFIIAQGKYLKYTANLLAQKGYQQVKSWRHCTLPEQFFIEYDSIVIFEPNGTKIKQQLRNEAKQQDDYL